MRHRKSALLIALAAALVAAALCSGAAQAAGPVWQISSVALPTNLPPEATAELSDSTHPNYGLPEYAILVTNVGSGPSDGDWTITDTLPDGITESGTGLQAVTLTAADKGGEAAIAPNQSFTLQIPLAVGALEEGSTATNQVSISGGGAQPVSSSLDTTISSEEAPFGLAGRSLQFRDSDGAPVTQAGSHPDNLTIQMLFSAVMTGAPLAQGELAGQDGGLRDLGLTLPKGVVFNPSATPVRCTEEQLENLIIGCPPASQVGVVDVLITPFGSNTVATIPSALFNVQAPPGSAAEFGFDFGQTSTFLHVAGGVRGVNGAYRLVADSNDIIARLATPVLGLRTELWANPSDPAHNNRRNGCLDNISSACSIPASSKALISMPSSCTSTLAMDVGIDSWLNPTNVVNDSFAATDLDGNPTGVTGCDSPDLDFQPTLKARPTTSLADSPSGLDVDLHVPQTDDMSQLATPHLRKAEVTLPPGLVLNPSSANGLEGCSSAQIGIDPHTGVPDGKEPACPDASRIGTVEVDTPLLDHALPGSIYVATPFDNPFDSLLAIYVTVDDPASGTLIKLAGHAVPNPDTGQLVTTFDENPQLPFDDFKLNIKSGVHGILRTPSACGTYSTTSKLTPWSAPASGPPATPSDSYGIAGGCSSGEPEFDAGAASPLAGKYTPFVVHLKREDGSQQFSKLTLTPPPGFTAKLAGTPACPEAALASAASKPGRSELAHPSCPADSRIGTVQVGAGAGPAPYYATGTAYLAGPYKGAPLSMAIVTPAVAGPYDLGTVVTRVALRLDPATAQITAEADPIPQILQGIPLDVRSIDVSLDKAEFSRTGTSCDPLAVNGTLISTLGQSAGLKSPYQLGNCANLPFKPKLSLQLKGGVKRTSHPRLIANLSASPGEANIAFTQVKLPKAAFLDQSHIRTVCTRVQFAADACPPGSIYGKASATTPLLGYPLAGNVYLRSSDHKLPDLVVALKGPDYQPIEIDLDGRTDAVKGALRNTFEAVPDAPVSKFHLELFGGKRGLIVLSSGFCKRPKATVKMTGQNGAIHDTTPVVRSSCPKKHHKRRKHRRVAG